MAFKPLKDRIDDLPLVICGPILRAVSEKSVTVWVALLKEQNITLTIFLEKDKNKLEEVSSVSTKTVNIGENLNLACITISNFAEPLKAGELYYYNLFFESDEITKSLLDKDIIDFNIFYQYEESMGADDIEAEISSPPKLPSFSLPPNDINRLKIIHGSCRKPNAEGLDAMPTIDKIIGSDWTRPDSRPHFLFLTGDQIYADDVSPIVLYMLIDAGSVLFGESKQEVFESQRYGKVLKDDEDKNITIEDENITIKNGESIWDGKLPNPMKRGRLIKLFAKFSDSSFHNHLISFAEYCCMYLFVWSNSLWDKLPESELMDIRTENYNDEEYNIEDYKKEIKRLTSFKSTLTKVRRALANVPTYMIFDDHEITDDWNMTKPWCDGVYSNKLGNRIIHNGLLAYTLFQAWGNTPEQFENPESGGKILKIISESWDSGKGYFKKESADEITGILGLPISGNEIFKMSNNDENQVIFNTIANENKIIKWHYRLIIKRNNINLCEIIVLDGRTKRSYIDTTNSEAKEYWHATLINDEHQAKQIPNDDEPFPLTIIVSPTAIIDIPAIDFSEFTRLSEKIAECSTEKEKHNFDIYDSWKNQSRGFESLLARFASRGINTNSKIETRNLILSGDVHFAAASRTEYEKKSTLNGRTQDLVFQAVFAQLVSSSFKKQEFKTRTLHYNGYKFTALAGLEQKIPKLFNFPILGLTLKILITLVDRLSNSFNEDEFYLFDPKLPKSKHFFGWEDKSDFGADLTSLDIKTDSLIGDKFEKRLLTTPTILSLSDAKRVTNIDLPKPHWRYTIDYILAENEVRENIVTNEIVDVGNPVPPDKNKALKEYLKAAKNHSEFTHKYGSGKEIVGLNNMSEVSFKWEENEKSVIQQTWWNLKSKDDVEEFFPLTKYIVPLDIQEEKLPKLKD
jgi:hypothetical protein